MRWPVVVAEENDEISGFMGTENRDDAVVGGPIIAGSGSVALRIILFYESILVNLGVRVYIFSVAKKAAMWVRAIMKTQRAEIMSSNGDTIWFRRQLHGL